MRINIERMHPGKVNKDVYTFDTSLNVGHTGMVALFTEYHLKARQTVRHRVWWDEAVWKRYNAAGFSSNRGAYQPDVPSDVLHEVMEILSNVKVTTLA